MRKVMTKARIKKLGLKTANAQRMMIKKHRSCMIQGAKTEIHYSKNYKGYVVDCDSCLLTITEIKI